MLKINLLPQEYREAERKPAGAYLMMAFCTLLSVSSLCCAAYLYFKVLKSAETKRDIAVETYENLAPMAKYADLLEAEKKEFTKRRDVIKEIETTRIHWTRKIDQLMAVINSSAESERHCGWLKDLKIRMGNSRQPGMELKGYLVGDQYEQLSNFNEDLKNHELFAEDFSAISNPTGSIVVDDKKNPATAIEFSWMLSLRDKAAKAPAKGR